MLTPNQLLQVLPGYDQDILPPLEARIEHALSLKILGFTATRQSCSRDQNPYQSLLAELGSRIADIKGIVGPSAYRDGYMPDNSVALWQKVDR